MEIIAHRGASGCVLENSRQALELGWRQEADRVEIDVRAIRDGKPLVIHDPTLNRTTTGQGPVSEFSWEELADVRLRNGEPLLSLAEALDLLRGRTQVYLEVKDPAATSGVARAVQGLEGGDRGGCCPWNPGPTGHQGPPYLYLASGAGPGRPGGKGDPGRSRLSAPVLGAAFRSGRSGEPLLGERG